MFQTDKSYFEHRAAQEVERAQRATVAAAARAHHELAEAYLDRAARAAPLQSRTS